MYKPVKLPYSFSDLEPYIDAETMEIHFNNHYLGYLDKLNKAVSKSQLFVPIRNLIENVPSTDIRNNGGGYFNHSLFFLMLTPPVGNDNHPSAKCPLVNFYMDRDFGGYENFKRQILRKAQSVFGSGWVWWVQYPNGETEIVTTANQDNPLMYNKNLTILLGIDVWEHAYYLKYKSFRDTYIKNIFNVINWEYVESQFYRG
jgi:Fe-Mn family superoxide dismutase